MPGARRRALSKSQRALARARKVEAWNRSWPQAPLTGDSVHGLEAVQNRLKALVREHGINPDHIDWSGGTQTLRGSRLQIIGVAPGGVDYSALGDHLRLNKKSLTQALVDAGLKGHHVSVNIESNRIAAVIVKNAPEHK